MWFVTSMWAELRRIIPVWSIMVVLPLPLLDFVDSGSARFDILGYLFVGSAIVAAETFRPDGSRPPSTRSERREGWHVKTGAIVLASLLSSAILSAAWLGATGGEASPWAMPLFSSMTGLAAVCLVPYLTLRTGMPYAAVVLASVLMIANKVAGDVVAIAVYGPAAREEGYLSATWAHPNLLACVLFTCSLLCCIVFYKRGLRRYADVAPHP